MGIGAVGVYLFATILGGFLFPHYSHISQAISELVGSHAPTRTLLNPIFLLYNLLLVGFTIGLYTKWNNKFTKLGAITLVILCIASILMWWFPMDSRGYPATQNGLVHIILASIESLATIIATFLFGFGLKKKEHLLSKISITAGISLLIIGPIAGFTVTQNSPFMGFVERITIGIFLLWVFIFSIIILKKNENIN